MDTEVKPKSMSAPTVAFAQGMRRIWLHKRLLIWLYLINVLFASVLIYPFRRFLSKVAKTDLADDFLTGFSGDSFVDIRMRFGSELDALGYAALCLGGLYVLVNIFLAAGIVATLALDHRVSFQRFLSNASRYFGRYLRLFVIFAIVCGGLLVGYKLRLQPFFEDLAEAESTDRGDFLWRALGVVILLIVVSLVFMVFDYAKVRTVVDRRRSMVVAAAVGLAFTLRRAWRCVRLFYLNVLLVCVLIAVFLLVGKQFSNQTTGSIVGLFAVQQLFIVGRIWMKMSFFASQLTMYESFAHISEPSPADESKPTGLPSTFRPMGG